MIILEILGNPIPQPRPRVVKNGNKIHSYDPVEKEKLQSKWYIKHQFNQNILSCPLSMNILYHMPIPKCVSKKMKTSMLNGKCHHIKRPDCDNLAKFTLDVLTGIVFDDDCQIVELAIRKIYAEKPKTLIHIEPITN